MKPELVQKKQREGGKKMNRKWWEETKPILNKHKLQVKAYYFVSKFKIKKVRYEILVSEYNKYCELKKFLS